MKFLNMITKAALLCLLLAGGAKAQSPLAKEWDKTFGGSQDDKLLSMITTPDGGYLLGGYSFSSISGDKSGANKGSEDYWVVKTDAAGNKLWDKTFGGNGSDILNSMVATPDGGYLLGGSSYSGISGNKTDINKGGSDYWVVKIDASGNKLWDKTFGEDQYDALTTVIGRFKFQTQFCFQPKIGLGF